MRTVFSSCVRFSFSALDSTKASDQAKMAVVAENHKTQYEPATGVKLQESTQYQAARVTPAPERDSSVYNEVMQIIKRGQEIEKSTPEAWRLSHEVAEIWSEHNGEKLNEQDFEVQKFIVITAEDIAKRNSATIITSLSNMADRSDDSGFVKKAFKLLIAIEHYAEKADPVLEETV
ncbi:MAG: hypothetical protein II966_01165, partial [Lachnospiraceae bacterium]|nr:hypothetical protein [Lachnospiraceae bacterium]